MYWSPKGLVVFCSNYSQYKLNYPVKSISFCKNTNNSVNPNGVKTLLVNNKNGDHESIQTGKGGSALKKVLVLEDETSIRSFVVINLKRAGYEPIEAGTGAEAFEQLRANPDIKVAILDIMLPDIDGFEVCRKIRAADPHIGIIMLTARTQEMDKVTGLMTGADDYVTKPFSPAELTARIDALYRRTGSMEQADTGEIVQGPIPFEHKKPYAGEKR